LLYMRSILRRSPTGRQRSVEPGSARTRLRTWAVWILEVWIVVRS
jgi:hypothetical protein